MEKFIIADRGQNNTATLLKSMQKSFAMGQQDDPFISKGKLIPGSWLEDNRKKVPGYSANTGIKEVKEEYAWRSTMNL